MEYGGLKVGILKAPEKVGDFERSWVRLPPGPPLLKLALLISSLL